MKRLLWIHHQYTSLLNLKIAVTMQLSEAKEIFVYGREADLQTFQDTTELVKNEVSDLVAAETMEGALSPRSKNLSKEMTLEKKRLTEIQHSYEDLYRELVLLSKLIHVGRKMKASEYFKKEIMGRFQNFFGQIDAWIAFDEKKLVEVEAGFVKLNHRHNLASIVGMSVILLIVLIYFILFVYLLGPRMKELFRGTRRIAEGDFSRPVSEKGNDEFANFAKAMNQMMTSLAESRKKLLEQSYYSGVADMVTGVLHNVKNALSPVLIDLESLEGQAKKIDSGKMLQAAQGLGGHNVSEERREDLLEYVGLSCAHLDEQTVKFQETLTMMKNKIIFIDNVLSEHNQFSETERPLELIRVKDLLEDSIALVRKDYLDKIAVVVEPSNPANIEIKTQRIVLIQVLANLLMNAFESIVRSGKSDGKVLISTEKNEANGGSGEIHITVSDNGEGLAHEQLTQIFQRGVSKKQGSFGLGLHWCANAVSSLDGQLYAESEGEGQGACFHLILEGLI